VAIARLREYSGPAILSYGFRPFFLAGGFYAGLGILIWLPFFFGIWRIPTAFTPVDWHIHEMLYGYLPAVITGFLLTAIPNWTGRLPLQGRPLAILVLAWLVGRLAVFFSADIGALAAAAVDLVFLVLVAFAAAREIVEGRNWRNLPPVGILVLFGTGNAIFHFEAYAMGAANFGIRIGIAAAIALITLIGGRVIPSFTRNWLSRRRSKTLPASFGLYDRVSIGVSALALAMWIAAPDSDVTGALMLSAAVMQFIRLGRWAGYQTLSDRLVLILHLGYFFVPIGFALISGSIFFPRQIPASAGIHAWMAGAVGIMTLAIMSRASLGHTGRPLVANAMTQIIYAAAFAAALTRICAALEPSRAAILLPMAAAFWVVAFCGFALNYGPLLSRPRMI